MDLGAVVRQARHDAELSQRALACAVGVPAETVCRIESGARRPSWTLLDRLLAACGRDLQLQLVRRHADLDGALRACAARPVEERLRDVGAFALPRLLAELGSAGVVVGGAWAVALHGLLPEGGLGRVWARDDVTGDGEPRPGSSRLLARVLRQHAAWVQLDGRWYDGSNPEPLLADGGTQSWQVRTAGPFEVVLLAADEPWPPAVWVETERGPVLVRPAEELVPADGVRADVLERWAALRRGA